MIVEYCDVCGKPIEGTEYSRFKIKKEHWSFGDRWWNRLVIHDECYNKICDYLKKGPTKNV